MLSHRCLSVLSVMLVHCGQTVGWIKMKLGMQTGLDPGHIVRWGPSSPSPKGAEPQFSAHICCGQMAVWIKVPLGTEVGLGPGDCVLWGPSLPQKKGHTHPTQFLAHVYCGQTAGWIKMPLHLVRRQRCVRWGRSSPLKGAQSPSFRFMSIVAKRLDGWRRHFVWNLEVDLGPGHNVLDWVPLSAKGAQQPPPLSGPCLLWPQSPISATAELLFNTAVQQITKNWFHKLQMSVQIRIMFVLKMNTDVKGSKNEARSL